MSETFLQQSVGRSDARELHPANVRSVCQYSHGHRATERQIATVAKASWCAGSGLQVVARTVLASGITVKVNDVLGENMYTYILHEQWYIYIYVYDTRVYIYIHTKLYMILILSYIYCTHTCAYMQLCIFVFFSCLEKKCIFEYGHGTRCLLRQHLGYHFEVRRIFSARIWIRQVSIHPSIQACINACIHTYRHTDRHTDIQTNTHSYVHTLTHIDTWYLHRYLYTYIHTSTRTPYPRSSC